MFTFIKCQNFSPLGRLFYSSLKLVALVGIGFLLPVAAFATDTVADASTYNVLLLIFFVVMAIGVSFTCSAAESTLLSITPSYIADIKDSDPKRADMLKKLKQDNVDQSLAAILTLNTIANTLGSIGAGAQANLVFGSAWFGVFSAVMTMAILTFSEIIPKTLGTVYWRQLSGVVAYFVFAIIKLLYPVIWLSERLTRLLVKGKDAHVFSRREFAALASVGEESGHIDPLESRIIRNMLAFGAIKVEDIMTPRSVIMAFEQSALVSDVFANHSKIGFSRLPVYDEGLDDITGFVLKTDLLLSKANGNLNQPLSNLSREVSFVFNKMKLFDLLDFMLKERIHIAIVVGEYGEVKGLVSLEDVLETLLGLEIVDEIDKVEDMQQLAKQLMHKRSKRLGVTVTDDKNDNITDNATDANGSDTASQSS